MIFYADYHKKNSAMDKPATAQLREEKNDDKKPANYNLDRDAHNEKYPFNKSVKTSHMSNYIHSTSFYVMLTLLIIITAISASSVAGLFYYRHKSRSTPQSAQADVEQGKLGSFTGNLSHFSKHNTSGTLAVVTHLVRTRRLKHRILLMHRSG